MTLRRLLASIADHSQRHAWLVLLFGVLLAAFSAWYASGHLGVITDTDVLFSPAFPGGNGRSRSGRSSRNSRICWSL